MPLLVNLLWAGFYGLKLHIIINNKGELLDLIITQANMDDRATIKENNFLKKIFGSLYANKGYIFKELKTLLFDKGLHMVTGIRNNKKNVIKTMRNKILHTKRSVIETINNQLKNITQAKYSRHKSFGNFITNLVANLIDYSFKEKKPACNQI